MCRPRCHLGMPGALAHSCARARDRGAGARSASRAPRRLAAEAGRQPRRPVISVQHAAASSYRRWLRSSRASRPASRPRSGWARRRAVASSAAPIAGLGPRTARRGGAARARAAPLRARIARTPMAPAAQQPRGARGDAGERQQIEPVVVQHRLEHRPVAAAHEVEIAPRDLEARTRRRRARPRTACARAGRDGSRSRSRRRVRARAWRAGAVSQATFFDHSRRATCSMSRCGSSSHGERRRWKPTASPSPARRRSGRCR